MYIFQPFVHINQFCSVYLIKSALICMRPAFKQNDYPYQSKTNRMTNTWTGQQWQTKEASAQCQHLARRLALTKSPCRNYWSIISTSNSYFGGCITCSAFDALCITAASPFMSKASPCNYSASLPAFGVARLHRNVLQFFSTYKMSQQVNPILHTGRQRRSLRVNKLMALKLQHEALSCQHCNHMQAFNSNFVLLLTILKSNVSSFMTQVWECPSFS